MEVIKGAEEEAKQASATGRSEKTSSFKQLDTGRLKVVLQHGSHYLYSKKESIVTSISQFSIATIYSNSYYLLLTNIHK